MRCFHLAAGLSGNEKTDRTGRQVLSAGLRGYHRNVTPENADEEAIAQQFRARIAAGSRPARAMEGARPVCEDMVKPKIAVVSSSSELAICFSHLGGIARLVKEAVRENLADAVVSDAEVIRPFERPYSDKPSIV